MHAVQGNIPLCSDHHPQYLWGVGGAAGEDPLRN